MADPIRAAVLISKRESGVNADEFFALIRKITNASSRVREHGADESTDLLDSYSPADSAALATVLSAAAACEKDHAALEAQLHAIVELTSTGHVTTCHISHLKAIDLEELPTSLREYVSDLLEG